MSSQRNVSDSDEGLMTFVIMLLIFIGTPITIWIFGHESLSYWGLHFAWQQLRFFELPIFPWVPKLRAEIVQLASHPADVGFSTLIWVMGKASIFIGWLPILVSILSIRSTLKHRSEKVKRPITVSNLPKIMSEHCKATIPVSYYGDLMNNDIPGHESRMHPAEFAKYHGLVEGDTLNEERTKSVFRSQLGSKIKKLSELKIYEKALFAVFASRVFETSENAWKAQDMLDRLNESCHQGVWKGEPGYPDFTVIKSEIDEYINMPEAYELLKYFNYPSTFLHKLHYQALERGVLPSSNFRWLKAMDRGLWYVLNATGRKVPCVESISQIQTYRAQNLAWSKGFVLCEPPLDQCINAFKNKLIAEGVLPKPPDPINPVENSTSESSVVQEVKKTNIEKDN